MCHPYTSATYAVLRSFGGGGSKLTHEQLRKGISEYTAENSEVDLVLAVRAERRLLHSECLVVGRHGDEITMTAAGERTKKAAEGFVRASGEIR